MVNSFDGQPSFSHHAVAITTVEATRPTTSDIDMVDSIFADLFGFALRYEVSEQDRTGQYRVGYLLPKGTDITMELGERLRERLSDTPFDPEFTLQSIEPKTSELNQMVFVGTSPLEALQDARQRLRDCLDDLDTETE